MGITATAIIAGAALATQTTNEFLVQPNQRRIANQKTQDAQTKSSIDQENLYNEAEAQRRQAETAQANANINTTAERSKIRQQIAARAQHGRAGTILTGPLGATDEAPTAQKTLLGG